jgi:hypothetical protein
VSFLNITKAIEAKIGVSEWNILFEKLFHQKLKMSKPSIHSVRNFYERVKRICYDFSQNVNKDEKDLQIKMKKDLTFFVIYNSKVGFYLKIETSNNSE